MYQRPAEGCTPFATRGPLVPTPAPSAVSVSICANLWLEPSRLAAPRTKRFRNFANIRFKNGHLFPLFCKRSRSAAPRTARRAGAGARL